MSNRTPKQSQLEQVAQGHQLLNTSRDGDSTVSLGNLFQFSITLRVKKTPKFSNGISCMFFIRGSFCLLQAILSTQAFSCPQFCLLGQDTSLTVLGTPHFSFSKSRCLLGKVQVPLMLPVCNTRCLSRPHLTHTGVKCSLWEEVEDILWKLPVHCTTASGHKEAVLLDGPFCYKACFSSVKTRTCLNISAWQNRSLSSGCCQSNPWAKPTRRQQRKRIRVSNIGYRGATHSL